MPPHVHGAGGAQHWWCNPWQPGTVRRKAKKTTRGRDKVGVDIHSLPSKGMRANPNKGSDPFSGLLEKIRPEVSLVYMVKSLEKESQALNGVTLRIRWKPRMGHAYTS